MFPEPIPNDNVPEGASEALSLVVSDPTVVAELRRLPAGIARQRFALDALRIGVLSMRAASGELDVRAIRDSGQQLVLELRGLLSERGTALTATMADALARYFDPATGVVTQKLERLTKDGGDLERVLRQHVGDESTLVRTLAAQVGEESPLFRMLSPEEASGVRAQIERTVGDALRTQSEQVLQQFSLDRKDSALSRLVTELATAHAAANTNMQQQVTAVVGEFSLDRPDSALSRLVGRVESAQKRISDEFSLDNQASALNKLTALLASLQQKQTEFASSVQADRDAHRTTRRTRTRHPPRRRSSRPPSAPVLAAEAQRLGDIYEATGTRTGLIKNCKVGDHVVTLGPDSSAPDASIVFEAKQSKSVDLKGALAEVEVARKNSPSPGRRVRVFDAYCARRHRDVHAAIWRVDRRRVGSRGSAARLGTPRGVQRRPRPRHP